MIETRRSSWIPWVFVGGFAVVLLANGTLTYFALSTWTGLETTGSYQRGAAYNEVLDEEAAQRALGWSLDARFAGDAAKGEIAVDLKDARGKPLAGALVTARLVRPTHEGHDIDLALPEIRRGSYHTRLSVPLPGQWDVRLEARHGPDTYRKTVRLFAPVPGK